MVHPKEPIADGIYLTWKPSSFIPFPQDFSDVEPADECINPRYFLTEDHMEPPISLSAMLTSMRYALHEIGITNQVSPEAYNAEVQQLEIDLCLLNAEMGKYNAIWMLLSDHLAYWDRYKEKILSATNIKNDAMVPNELLAAAEAFDKEITHSFSSQNIKVAFTKLSSEAKSLLNKYEPECAVRFRECAKKYFHSALSVNNNDDAAKLIGFLERVLKDESYSGPENLERTDVDGLKVNLQKAADKVSGIIAGIDGNSPTWLTDMQQTVNNLMSWLFTSKNKKPKGLLYRYTAEGGSCVAILNIKSSGQDRAFFTTSGFSDCQDHTLLHKLKIELPYLMQGINFEKICKMLSDAYEHPISYVAYTKSIAAHIVMFGVDPCKISRKNLIYRHVYDYSWAVTLKEALSRVKPEDDIREEIVGALKCNFSCCERKILAYLEAENILVDPPAAKWYIKFHPCIQCSHAIDLWRRKHGLTELLFLLSS